MNKERTDRQVEHNSGHLTVKKDTKLQSHDGDRKTFEVMTPIYTEYKHNFCGTSVIK